MYCSFFFLFFEAPDPVSQTCGKVMIRKMTRTPVADFIRIYSASEPLRLHMPGHKGHGPAESLDLTEIQGLPPLYPASGIVRESENIAAELFGAGRTVYSAEGSSLCIRAMLLLVKMRAEREGQPPLILAGRNAHRSFLSAAALLGMEVAWLQGESLLTCRPSSGDLEAALARLPDVPAAVYLTSPDYLGFRTDIQALASICHARRIPLLVDNAHGAYLRFLPEDLHPLSLGADLTCDSAHKTLPVLTGGACLQISASADPLFSAQAERAMALFASTSPSWLILQSLDRCNALLAGSYRERLKAFVSRANTVKDHLRDAGFTLLGDEPLKITLAPKSRGYSGDSLHALLRQEGIECEFSDPDYLVMMLTPETEAEGLARLEKVLAAVPRKPPITDVPPPLPRPEPVLPLPEAMMAEAEDVPVRSSLGRVLADPCVGCPPAVPILISGERISAEAIRCFRYYGMDSVSCCVEPRNRRHERL